MRHVISEPERQTSLRNTVAPTICHLLALAVYMGLLLTFICLASKRSLAEKVRQSMGYQSKKVRPVRLEVSLPETILAAVDDYRFATRAPNRAEAIRRLLKLGQAATPAPRRRSN